MIEPVTAKDIKEYREKHGGSLSNAKHQLRVVKIKEFIWFNIEGAEVKAALNAIVDLVSGTDDGADVKHPELERFDEAAQAMAFKGSLPPEDRVTVVVEYNTAKSELLSRLEYYRPIVKAREVEA